MDAGKNGRLVGLEYFSIGFVEFDAVPVKWDVTARYHDAGALGLQGVEHQCGRGKAAQESNHQAQIFHGLADRTQDASLVSIGARAKVPSQADWIACLDGVHAQEVFQKARGIDVDLQIGHGIHFASESAGSEFETFRCLSSKLQ